MTNVPSGRMFLERPPSAEETFRRLVSEAAVEVIERPIARRAKDAIPTRAFARADEVAPTAEAPGAPQLDFREIYSSPENQIFKVVFFPDRVFHAQYLNATRAAERYRYAVSDARSILDISVLKAQVFLDGQKMANVLRIEYRAGRLIELTRESGRFLREEVIAWVRIHGKVFERSEDGRLLDEDGNIYRPGGPTKPQLRERTAEQPVKMHFCPWINAYQVEIWQTLEPPTKEVHHHFQVLAQMGPTGSITRVRSFSPILEVIDELTVVEMAFRENDVDIPYGKPITDPKWDNNYERNFQAPNSPFPSDNEKNTVPVGNYLVNFQRGWFLDANTIAPVRYRNAMMDSGNPELVDPNAHPELNQPAAWTGNVPLQSFADANVIEMRWILQREFGGSVVFFHEVTIPPGTVEGTHCHVGSEELYYIVSGEGIAYMGASDDPKTTEIDAATGHPRFEIVKRSVFGLFEQDCVELPVKPGNVIFTKSGGVHGIKNVGDVPLKFVAFLYHSV
jgi:mannose-6-phosphate isomerase-like protein (cupin superfamily)